MSMPTPFSELRKGQCPPPNSVEYWHHVNYCRPCVIFNLNKMAGLQALRQFKYVKTLIDSAADDTIRLEHELVKQEMLKMKEEDGAQI